MVQTAGVEHRVAYGGQHTFRAADTEGKPQGSRDVCDLACDIVELCIPRLACMPPFRRVADVTMLLTSLVWLTVKGQHKDLPSRQH